MADSVEMKEIKPQDVASTTKSTRRSVKKAPTRPLAEMLGYNQMAKVLADSICARQPPLTVGVYGKWGSGKSRALQCIVDRMAKVTSSSIVRPHIKTNMFSFLFRLLFFYPIFKNTKRKDLKYIFVQMTALDYVGSDKIWAGIITKISRKVDRAFTARKVKYFRAAHSRPHSLDIYEQETGLKRFNTSKKWKPSPIHAYIIPILSLIALGVTIALIVIYGFPVIKGADTTIGSIFTSLFVGALGVGTVTQIGNVAKFIMNLVRTQSSKITSMAKKPDFSSSLGFMSKIKNEIRYMTALVAFMGHLADKDIRICLVIDDVDRLNKKQVMDLFQVVTLLDNAPNSPFVQILCMDPLVVANIVKKALSYELASNINGHEYIKRIVRVPFNIPMLETDSKQRVLNEMVARHGRALNRFKAYGNGNGSVHTTSNDKSYNTSEKEVLIRPSHTSQPQDDELIEVQSADDINVQLAQAFHCLSTSPDSIKCVENGLSAINRIIHSVEVSVRLMTSLHRNGRDEVQDLAAWVTLADQWPYRLSWLWQYIEDNRQRHTINPFYPRLPSSAFLEDIYRIVASDLNKTADWENLISLDGDPELFKTFLQIHCFTVEDMERFLPYTFNLNYSLKRIIAGATARIDAAENATKLANLKRKITEQKLLINWSVDDVCKELNEIGLREDAVPRYQEIAKEHSIDGKTLVKAPLADLKAEFKMSVGDWTTFCSHLKAYRTFFGNGEAEIPLPNTTGSPEDHQTVAIANVQPPERDLNPSVSKNNLDMASLDDTII